ncbi:hypothetical protein BDZ94DRAFT_1213775 [Collybia nuda]|uniref:Uncharacterized protein n=1 Tax=Collybia nuda TaxID=64659 RepID=A0A9P5Y9L4_9AGAR|nr:hypothetical protein BDZ94DRAFT_1213775 [Collybia nuda]
MSSFFNKLKSKAMNRKSGSHDKSASTTSGEQSFSIQPHPAKTNDPADLQRGNQPGGGLGTSDPMAAHHARDPHVPSQQIMNNLEEPLSREELRARGAELNK